MSRKNITELEDDCLNRYDYMSGSASGTDCTGLIPSGTTNVEELESYEDVYPFVPPILKITKKKDTLK